MKRTRALLACVGVVYVATWVLISWLSVPALDSYGDMVENYAWSQTWTLGTFRHPPLFAWIVGAWFTVFPTHVWAYYVLSYVNAWIGVLGIVSLARLWVPDTVSPCPTRCIPDDGLAVRDPEPAVQQPRGEIQRRHRVAVSVAVDGLRVLRGASRGSTPA